MRVTPDELLVDVPRHGFQASVTFFLEQEREEEGLEEEVAELVEELRRVVGERGVGDLVRLLDRVRDDRARGLLTIPGAVAPQTLGQALEIEERLDQRRPTRVNQWS